MAMWWQLALPIFVFIQGKIADEQRPLKDPREILTVTTEKHPSTAMQGKMGRHLELAPGVVQEEVREDIVSLMMAPWDGAQPGLMEEETSEALLDEAVAEIRRLRDRDPRSSRNLVHLLTNYVLRGVRSRLPSMRQFERELRGVLEAWWVQLRHLQNNHADCHANWVWTYWGRVRSRCRAASRRAVQRQRVLRDRAHPEACEREQDQMDVDEALQQPPQGEQDVALEDGAMGQDALQPLQNGYEEDKPPVELDVDAALHLDQGRVEAESPKMEESPQQEAAPRGSPEAEVVELMQRYSNAPWKARPRDKWLGHGDGDGEHRRRWKWKDQPPRSKEGSPPRKSKGKGKGKKGQGPFWTTKTTRRLAPLQRRPPRTDAGSSRARTSDTCRDEDMEVVEVEDESGAASSSRPAREEEPGRELLTMADARSLWRSFQDLDEEDDPMGYPQWTLDRVRDTIVDWETMEISTLMLAHTQMQALQAAQVSQILQEQLDRLAGGEEEQEEEPENACMMQTTAGIWTQGGAISSFTLMVDQMSKELQNMAMARQKSSAELLRGMLSQRYGTGIGRSAMGDKAKTIEALVGAYGIDDTDADTDYMETSEDKLWAGNWWQRFVTHLVKDDAELRNAKKDAAILVQDSCEGAGSASSTQLDRPASVMETASPDRLLQAEREEYEAAQRAEQAEIDKAIAKHEQDVENERRADEERYETLQAMRVREWEDWTMAQNLGQASGGRRVKLKIQISMQGHLVEPSVEVDMREGSTWEWR